MTLDANDFFRQATVRICSSLDVESALWRCLHYLETIMPATGMNLHLFDQNMTVLRTVAYVSHYEMEKLNRVITLPPEVTDRLKRDWKDMRDVIIINRPELNLLAWSILRIVEKADMSIMVMRLELEGKGLGGLALFTDGRGLYSKEHARLFSSLHDPFAIAMSNALRHEEIINLKNALVDDVRYFQKELYRISGDEIIGERFGLSEVMGLVRLIAPLENPVLIIGETGAGKEVIANAVHYNSPRKHGPFIKVNCGAIPDTLIDSELFGHERGAFTGAIARKRGRFERAHQGTILLDEIGELPPQAQVRLLRVLQEKRFERVGGAETISVDIRVIAATHQNLEQMVKKKKFREDLWFRLNVFPIVVPPLRERQEDIPALAFHFVERKSSGKNLPTPLGITPGAINLLKSYHWPGNVRELENVMERAVIQYRAHNKSGPLTSKDFILPQPQYSQSNISANNKLLKLNEVITLQIQQALRLTGGKIHGPGGAGELLGINPYTLRSKIKKLGIPYKKMKYSMNSSSNGVRTF